MSELWGLEVGSTFGILSIFHRVDRSGAIVFGTLMDKLAAGEWDMVDCGVQQSHFSRFGALVVSREKFIEKVVHGLIRKNSSRGTRVSSDE